MIKRNVVTDPKASEAAIEADAMLDKTAALFSARADKKKPEAYHASTGRYASNNEDGDSV